MSNYTGSPCPVCGQAFLGGDDIVVCPECGAPYHRECYHQAGRCVLDDLHNTGELWQPPKSDHPEHPHQAGSRQETSGLCPRCGYQNPGDAMLCQYCGWRLGAPYTAPEPRPVFGGNTQQGAPPFQQPPPRSFHYFFQQDIGFNEEMVPGVTYKEVSDFIGPNSIRFLTKFKFLLQGAIFSLNWPALFFSVYYCFYRKMYKFGAILTAILLCAIVPYLISIGLYMGEVVRVYGVDVFLTFSLPQIDGQALQNYLLFSRINNIVQLVVSIIAGLMFNKAYMKETCKKILEVKKNGHYSTGSMEYSYALARSGGSTLVPVVALGALYFAANLLVAFYVMLPFA